MQCREIVPTREFASPEISGEVLLLRAVFMPEVGVHRKPYRNKGTRLSEEQKTNRALRCIARAILRKEQEQADAHTSA